MLKRTVLLILLLAFIVVPIYAQSIYIWCDPETGVCTESTLPANSRGDDDPLDFDNWVHELVRPDDGDDDDVSVPDTILWDLAGGD